MTSTMRRIYFFFAFFAGFLAAFFLVANVIPPFGVESVRRRAVQLLAV